MDWYWNRGGREKVQARRYIREYEREKAKKLCIVQEQQSQQV